MKFFCWPNILIFHHNLQINSLKILQCDFLSYFVSHSWGIPMMKITGLSHLFKWENLHNWWLTILFCPTVYIRALDCDHFLRVCEYKFDIVALVRVHGLRCSKESASYSTHCRATAHCSRIQISLITWRDVLSAGALQRKLDSSKRFVGRVWFILTVSVWRCAPRTESNRGFGFQTKVKDPFLNQKRWTCWYSCRKKTCKSCQRQPV